MGPLQLIQHLLSFIAPAFFVSLFVLWGARWLGLAAQAPRWWAQGAINFTAGAAVLAAGLWIFGVDGKMATYAAMAAAIGTAQWFCSRGWKR
jgi:hypothetical protein